MPVLLGCYRAPKLPGAGGPLAGGHPVLGDSLPALDPARYPEDAPDRLITKWSRKGNRKTRFRPLRTRVSRNKRVNRSRRIAMSGYEDFPEL